MKVVYLHMKLNFLIFFDVITNFLKFHLSHGFQSSILKSAHLHQHNFFDSILHKIVSFKRVPAIIILVVPAIIILDILFIASFHGDFIIIV